jgi:hypothetical protein
VLAAGGLRIHSTHQQLTPTRTANGASRPRTSAQSCATCLLTTQPSGGKSQHQQRHQEALNHVACSQNVSLTATCEQHTPQAAVARQQPGADVDRPGACCLDTSLANVPTSCPASSMSLQSHSYADLTAMHVMHHIIHLNYGSQLLEQSAESLGCCTNHHHAC